MNPVKGFKFRIRPNAEQRVLIENTFGSCRFVWNTALTTSSEAYELYKKGILADRPKVSPIDFAQRLTGFRKEYPWLINVSATATQQSLLLLGKTFASFFKGATGYPKYKSKKSSQSFNLTVDAFRLKGKELYIAKCKESVKVLWSRDLPSIPTRVTVSKDRRGRYFASFLCEYVPVKTTGEGIVGIDLGIKELLICSNGERVDNPRPLMSKLVKLRRLSRRLSRKKPGSNNRVKAKIKLSKFHGKVADSRKDYLHKVSTTLVRDNQVIGMETLSPKNMMQNRNLAKHIGDVGWGMLVNFLKYKSLYSVGGCQLAMVGTFYPSSHICSSCRTKLPRKLLLKERSWTCPICLVVHDRDMNASLNLRFIAETIKGFFDTPWVVVGDAKEFYHVV